MAKRKFTAPKGMRDIMPDEAALFRHVEETFRETCRLFGYREIRTPHLEQTDLFCRTVGETTDIVEKEMYTLTTKGGDELALRPENTAGVVRAYLEHGMHRSAPLQKFFYWGEMFRHEAKQKKRYREFTQAGVELLGSQYPAADAEVIALAAEFFRKLGLGDVRIELATFGCSKCRPAFRAALLAYYEERESELCDDCRRRLQNNVFRLLDCKEDSCRASAAKAPTIDGFLDNECRPHFKARSRQCTHPKESALGPWPRLLHAHHIRSIPGRQLRSTGCARCWRAIRRPGGNHWWAPSASSWFRPWHRQDRPRTGEDQTRNA